MVTISRNSIYNVLHSTPKGIDVTGNPTINVCGSEVPLNLYWDITSLSETGQSKIEIVDQLALSAGANIAIRAYFVLVVNNVLENMRLLQASAVASIDDVQPSKRSRPPSRLNLVPKMRPLTQKLSPKFKLVEQPQQTQRTSLVKPATRREPGTPTSSAEKEKRRRTVAIDRAESKGPEEEFDFAELLVEFNRQNLA